MRDADDFMNALDARPEVQAAYQERGHALHLELLRARQRAQLTQEQVAERMNTQKTAISRLESPRCKSLPSLQSLTRYAAATGHRLRVILEPLPTQQSVGG